MQKHKKQKVRYGDRLATEKRESLARLPHIFYKGIVKGNDNEKEEKQTQT